MRTILVNISFYLPYWLDLYRCSRQFFVRCYRSAKIVTIKDAEHFLGFNRNRQSECCFPSTLLPCILTIVQDNSLFDVMGLENCDYRRRRALPRLQIRIILVNSTAREDVSAGSPSRGGDVAVYVFDINLSSLPTPF